MNDQDDQKEQPMTTKYEYQSDIPADRNYTDIHGPDGMVSHQTVLDLLAAAAAPGLDELLVELTDDMLPGLAVGIARNCGKWDVQQVYDGLDESWPTGIHGEGDTLTEALRNAVAQATGITPGDAREGGEGE